MRLLLDELASLWRRCSSSAAAANEKKDVKLVHSRAAEIASSAEAVAATSEADIVPSACAPTPTPAVLPLAFLFAPGRCSVGVGSCFCLRARGIEFKVEIIEEFNKRLRA